MFMGQVSNLRFISYDADLEELWRFMVWVEQIWRFAVENEHISCLNHDAYEYLRSLILHIRAPVPMQSEESESRWYKRNAEKPWCWEA